MALGVDGGVVDTRSDVCAVLGIGVPETTTLPSLLRSSNSQMPLQIYSGRAYLSSPALRLWTHSSWFAAKE